MNERQPMTLDQKVLNQQASLSQSKEPGIMRRGVGKGMDIATGVSKFTIWGFAGTWAAAEFAPGAVSALGVNPNTAAEVGKWGTIIDAGTLVFDKFRKKDNTGSLPKQGNIFTSSAKSIGKGLWTVPRDTFGQVNPIQQSSKHAFGF